MSLISINQQKLSVNFRCNNIGLALRLVLLGLFLQMSCYARASEYDGVFLQTDVMVQVRDGTHLATDIYRPSSEGEVEEEALPALLHRTPYNKSDPDRLIQIEAFVKAGYVVVVQDTRGRYGSEGSFSKYHDFDAPDGYDTIEWVAKLPYVNGKVGMWGTSYPAHTQADAAKLNPPSLKTIILNQGGLSNPWASSIRQGGAFELGRELSWAWRQIPDATSDPVLKALFQAEPINSWYEALPLREGLSPLAAAPEYETYILNEWRNGDYTDFWKRIGFNWQEYYDDTSDIPMLHIGGWYDIFLRSTVQNYLELSDRKSSDVRMLIGPWTHSNNDKSYAGDVDFGASASIADFDTGFHLRWFDHYLKGHENGIGEENALQIFVMGTGDGKKLEDGRLYHGGFWATAPAWPIPEAQTTRLYLNEAGLRKDPPNPQSAATTTYTHDPDHPVPTIGGSVSSRLKDGAYNQRERPDFPGSQPPYLPLRARSDVAVFQTELLEEDIQIAGPVTVHLFVSSTAVDTDFTVKLVDVYPPSRDFTQGFDINISDAIMRASYRNGRATRELIEPGKVYELTIELFPTANVFKKGHRIRLDIASSSFPRWDVNPGTGEPLGKDRRKVSADNTIYHSSKYTSFIELPVTSLERTDR